VPTPVRERVAEALGAPVVRGVRVWGGYSPTPTYRLVLADGGRAFFKGVNADSTEFAKQALGEEQRVYRDLAHLIAPVAPRFFGSLSDGDWHALLLEDLGPKSAPPWSRSTLLAAVRGYAAFHASTLGSDLPSWLPGPREILANITWARAVRESDDLRAVAQLAGDRSDGALAWLRDALPALAYAADTVGTLAGPYALLHLDTRSDNLRVCGGQLRLFDWPFAGIGRPEIDVAAFAQSVAVEGGAAPEQVVAWYSECLPLRDDALDAAVSWLAAFFAHHAWRPDLPGLPRLRRFQRQQLRVTLAWAARRLGLPEPDWVESL
jgi:hypothetical protein